MIEGAELGAYRVIARIGAGGMGEVWLAEHVKLGRRAAIKVLRPELTADAEVVRRFFNEARAATAISDPGIVQIFDFGHHTDGSAYIVMELLEGEALDERLHRLGVLPLGDALRIIRQVASSLSAAHAGGIIHRDLKPENIFLVRDAEVAGGERVKILDFGIAKLTSGSSSQTSTSAVMGTPLYMSPEQCRGAGRVDQRSDLYSLGCVLFALLTGDPPFTGEGAGDLIVQHITEPAPLLSTRVSGLPRSVETLVARCLEKDPNDRFATASDLAAAMNGLITQPSLGSLPVISAVMPTAAGASPTTLSSVASSMASLPPVTTPSGRGKWIAGGIGIVVVAGAIAFVLTRTGGGSGSAGAAAASAPPQAVDAARLATVPADPVPADAASPAAPVDAAVLDADAETDGAAAAVPLDAAVPMGKPAHPLHPAHPVHPGAGSGKHPRPTVPHDTDGDGIPDTR